MPSDHARPRKPSMQDVAQLADVSVQTVSRVLNDKPNVSEQTRERVQRAIQELDYHRNTAAVALVTQYSKVLGVVDCGMDRTGPYETIRAVHRAAHEAGYFVSFAHSPSLTAASVRSVLDSLLEQGVDGIVFVAPHYEALSVIHDLKVSVPTVVVAPSTKFPHHTVELDNQATARLAVDHLTSLSHRRLVHLAGPLDWVDANVRMEAWYHRVQRASLPVLPTFVGDWTARSGYERGRQIMREVAPTAIFAANDQMALGVLRALSVEGYRVPQDVSVIGFGDVDDAEFYSPPLTTIREDFDEVGRQSIAMLLDLVRGDERTSVLVEPELVVRRSTGPAPMPGA
ncbi:LacI family DNA-binding transcriptional regulator [Cellulomonas iranensis]|uniref:LacI family DNA-binding transcriptional regulator n=1 Tax=Cellulomonas iranensis TaxID=76862 RepID=UPI001CF4C6BD|nr:LacI family DNA-binding transcriptional regulator [Cellulomonas iranensis]UCN15344.1 LacI family DNA-binding transcriptional regulator [Cellulomonas iranensis]